MKNDKMKYPCKLLESNQLTLRGRVNVGEILPSDWLIIRTPCRGSHPPFAICARFDLVRFGLLSVHPNSIWLPRIRRNDLILPRRLSYFHVLL